MAVIFGTNLFSTTVFCGLERCLTATRVISVMSTRRISTTNVNWKRSPVPTSEEVEKLSGRFPDPAGIVSRFLQPVTELDPEQDVQLSVKQQGSKWWRVCLEFSWPLKFKICARNCDVQTAETNAYLLACDTLNNMGLLTKEGEIIPFTDELMKANLERLPGFLVGIQNRCTFDPIQKWTSEVSLNWPNKVTCQGSGLTQEDATRNAAVLVFMKLKAMRCLDSYNCIISALHLRLPEIGTDIPFSPHYEVYTDASLYGYGAVLYSKDPEDKQSGSVRWISEHWPDELQPHFLTPRVNSTVFEFCGILSSIYTWKKKFADKQVLVYSDNLCVCVVINDGLKPSSRYRRKTCKQLLKMFKVLREACVKHNIKVRAQWLDRQRNRPADALSKLNQSLFRALVPNARQTSKKPKKMLFCLPLVETLKKKDKVSEKSEADES